MIRYTSKSIVFRNTSVVFLDINNKRHTYIGQRIFHLGKGCILLCLYKFYCINTVFFNLIELFVLQYCFRHCAFCNLNWGITIYHHLLECTTINYFISIQQVQDYMQLFNRKKCVEKIKAGKQKLNQLKKYENIYKKTKNMQTFCFI